MAAELNFSHLLQNASNTQKDDFLELYEQARKATQEAQRQGDAQLKAAIEAAMLMPMKAVRGPLFESNMRSALQESCCSRTSNVPLDKENVMPIVYQVLLRTSLMYLIFNSCGADSFTFIKIDFSLWLAALFVTMLIMPSQSITWCRGYRGISLLLALTLLWFGEVVAVLATYSHLALDMAHLFSQCIFASLLHRIPFCSHLKARLFGIGLQSVGTLAMVPNVYKALPAILYFSSNHLLCILLAYVSDQHQWENGFLKTVSCLAFNKMCTVHNFPTLAPQASPHQEVRKRALGGFAGGFAGVSSLKCPSPPPIWTDPLPSFSVSSRAENSIEDSCSSSAIDEECIDCPTSPQQHFSYQSLLNEYMCQTSNVIR